ncbi:MAG TPA: hypothetical protein VF116_23065 [Ktedonobacterales bacterium]
MPARRVFPLRLGVGRCAAFALFVLAACVLASGCATSSTRAANPTTPGPAATFTPNPLTPTPTTSEARINALVRQAVGTAPLQIQTVYQSTSGQIEVTLTLGGTVPTSDADVSAMQERVKTLCFEAQRAVWAGGLLSLSQVTITVVGPIMDQYAELETQAYGAAVLKAATEQRFTWSTLSPDGAWGAYDNTYLRPAYYDVD